MVVGDGVDSATLTRCLKKKVGHATIVSIEEIKPKVNVDKPKPVQWTPCCQGPQLYITTMDCPEQPTCSIM